MANIITTTVSPVLAALFVAEEAARNVVETHQREVLDVPAPASMSKEQRTQQVVDNNALNDLWCDIHYEIAGHPAATTDDLKAKLEFMVEHRMGDGKDWLPTILEDVQRIEPATTPEWSEALKRYEQTTADNVVALSAYNVAEEAYEGDPHVEAVRAYAVADARLSETTDAQSAAIRALIMTPAPSLSALLVNMQILIDTGMIACTDLNNALAADLRRFSNYVNQEA